MNSTVKKGEGYRAKGRHEIHACRRLWRKRLFKRKNIVTLDDIIPVFLFLLVDTMSL
jgi:hypothetical protein